MTRSVVPKEYRQKPIRDARSTPLIVYTWHAVALSFALIISGLVALVVYLVLSTEVDATSVGLLASVIIPLCGLVGVIAVAIIKFFTA